MTPAMDIIGRHLPSDFWHRHPESESALRGVLALIAAADWRGYEDVERHLQSTVSPAGEGRMVIADPDGRFLLSIHINYPRQLVHIVSVEEMPRE